MNVWWALSPPSSFEVLVVRVAVGLTDGIERSLLDKTTHEFAMRLQYRFLDEASHHYVALDLAFLPQVQPFPRGVRSQLPWLGLLSRLIPSYGPLPLNLHSHRRV